MGAPRRGGGGRAPNEVLDAANREYVLAPSGAVYDISSANSAPGVATCDVGCTCAGTRGAAADGVLWLLDEATGLLRRCAVQPGGELVQTAAASGSDAPTATGPVPSCAPSSGGRPAGT